jgi:hypothetical protein
MLTGTSDLRQRQERREREREKVTGGCIKLHTYEFFQRYFLSGISGTVMREADSSTVSGVKRGGDLSMQNVVKKPEGTRSLDTARSRWE